MRAAPTIYVIDDEEDLWHSLEWLWRPCGFQMRIFTRITDFLAAYSNNPGCLILDIHLPGTNGLSFARELPAHKIDLPLIVMSREADIRTAVDAMKAGAIDFILKPVVQSKLRELVRAAVQKNILQRERRRGACKEACRSQLLTPRERDVMVHLVEGKSNREIATSLGIGLRTVETHRAEVLHKLDVKSVAELVRLVVAGAEAVR
jgi:FixJ family two-component response regulator